MGSNRWVSWWVCLLIMITGCISIHPPIQFLYTHRPSSEYPVRIIPVYIDQDFGQEDRMEMQKAIDQWNFALNGYIRIIIADRPFDMSTSAIEEVQLTQGWTFMKIKNDNPMIIDHNTDPDKPKYFTLAFCNKIGGDKTWFVRDRFFDENQLREVTIHEIGHLLGASHNGKYLMSPHYNVDDYQCIDKATMLQVSGYINIPLANLNYCLYEGD